MRSHQGAQHDTSNHSAFTFTRRSLDEDLLRLVFEDLVESKHCYTLLVVVERKAQSFQLSLNCWENHVRVILYFLCDSNLWLFVVRNTDNLVESLLPLSTVVILPLLLNVSDLLYK